MDRTALGLVIMVTAIWGTGPVTARFLVGVSGEITPADLTLMRWLIAFLFLFFVLIRNQSLNETTHTFKVNWRHFLAIGVTTAAFGLLFLFGVSMTFATNAALLTNLHPAFLAVSAYIFHNERVSTRTFVGIVIALGGASIVITQGNFSLLVFSSERFVGDLLMILSAFAWAIQTILVRKYVNKYGGLQIMTLSVPFAILVSLPFALILGNLRALFSVSLIGLLLILHFSLIISGVAYVLWYLILDRMAATKASVCLLIIPIYTIIFAFFLLNEPITLSVVGGAALVLMGIYLVETTK